MTKRAVGVDLGGTFIKAGVVDDHGRILSRVKIDTQYARGPDMVVARIALAASKAVERAKLTWPRIGAVGLGSPGIFEPGSGVVSMSPNMPELAGLDLAGLVRERIGRKHINVFLDNDANLAAFAEYWVGSGGDTRDLVLFTLGTGIGGGIVLNGDIWRGAWGVAGEFGHMNLFPDGVRCGCGNHGCLEAYASAPALARRFKEAVGAGRPSSLAPLLARGAAVSARDISRAAGDGDRTCRELIEETGRFLGIGVMNMLHILNVERVIFAGGMTAAGELLLEPIRAEARRRTLPLALRNVEIVFSKLGNDAGLIGAGGWAMRAAK